MMMNEFATRRGYDDRYENLDGWTRQGQRRTGGDWMRESPWMREPAWLRGEPGWGHPYAWGREPYGYGREQGWGGGWGGEPYAWGQPYGGYGREQGWRQGYGYGQPWGREPSWLRSQELGYEPMVKVIEVVAESPHSWEDATRRAIAEASQSVRGIRSIHIEEMQAVADDEHVLGFRVHAKIAYSGGRR